MTTRLKRPMVRRRARSEAAGSAPRVLVAAPPRRAVGGVAAYTDALLKAMPEAQGFDQWWPLRRRSGRAAVRMGVHASGLARWAAVLVGRRPDLVHLQVTSPGLPRDIAYLRLARAAGIPVVAHMHTSGFVGPDVPSVVEARVRTVIAGVDGIVVMSRTAADGFIARYGVSPDRVHVVPNPAPAMAAGEAAERSPSACRFVCVGEISRLKGQVPLARAAEELARDGIACEVSLVGPVSAIAEDELAFLQRSAVVDLRGVRRGPDLATELARSDVFALFSFTEAEPMAMLEAMAVGLPVIATAVGSIPDALAAAGPGNALVPAGDEGALLAAMRASALDAESRASTGARNREWAQDERSMDRHVATLRAVYRTVLRDAPASAPAFPDPERSAGPGS